MAFAYATDHTVVVKGNTPIQGGNTVVKPESDSLVVTPAANVSSIIIKVTDTTGSVLSMQALPANINITVGVQTPTLPTGCILEIHDDNGVVYSEYEN
jgi:hypothetical protein